MGITLKKGAFMRRRKRLFSGEIHCTICHQEGKSAIKRESWNLLRNEDGTYSGYCHDHKPEDIYQDDKLCLVETCLHYPWPDVVKLTLHKPDPSAFDRKGEIVTVEMKTVPNIELMRRHAIEVLHGLQLMASDRATVHNYGESGEGNYCWTDNNYHWESPALGFIRDKYWGDEQIKAFQEICRVMCATHGWELVDETMSLLDRIVAAVSKDETS
jgi:hypothetical protein